MVMHLLFSNALNLSKWYPATLLAVWVHTSWWWCTGSSLHVAQLINDCLQI